MICFLAADCHTKKSLQENIGSVSTAPHHKLSSTIFYQHSPAITLPTPEPMVAVLHSSRTPSVQLPKILSTRKPTVASLPSDHSHQQSKVPCPMSTLIIQHTPPNTIPRRLQSSPLPHFPNTTQHNPSTILSQLHQLTLSNIPTPAASQATFAHRELAHNWLPTYKPIHENAHSTILHQTTNKPSNHSSSLSPHPLQTLKPPVPHPFTNVFKNAPMDVVLNEIFSHLTSHLSLSRLCKLLV